MSRLDRYLFSQLSAPFGVALTTFLLVGMTAQWFRLLTRAEVLPVTPGSVFRWMLFLTPALAGLVIPAAFLAAALLTVSRLGAEGELVGLAAAGLSPWRISRPLLVAGALAALLAALAGAYGEPWGRRQARNLLADLQGRSLTSALPPGRFKTLVPGLQVRAGLLPAPDLMLADDRNPDQPYTAFARHFRIDLLPSQTLRLELRDGLILRAHTGGSYERTRFDTLRLSIPLPDLGGRTELADYFPAELEARIARLKADGKKSVYEELALAKKRAYPTACIAFALLALPLGSSSHRAPRARAWLMATAVLTAYYLAIRVVDATVLVSGLPAAVGVWLPNAVLASIGAAALARRARRV